MPRRIEITVSEGTWVRLEAARGHEPRASFVKRALEKALGLPSQGDAPGVGGESRVPGVSTPAPPRASVSVAAAMEAADEVSAEQGFAENYIERLQGAAPKRRAKPAAGGLPSIAPRHWGGS